MKRIDFIVIGTQKAGTTALYYYLKKHPLISMPIQKELHYFCQNDGSVGPHTYHRYHEHFDMENSLVKGEITPDYIGHIDCPKRIHQYNPNIKLVVILRNPIDRAFSHWNMYKRLSREKRPFWYCILLDSIKSLKSKVNKNITTTYFRKGLYSDQIKNFYQYFRKEQVLILKYEDFVSHQEELLKNIFEFLGVQHNTYEYQFKEVFKSNYHTQMPLIIRWLLRLLYRKDIAKIEKMYSWNCSDWM